MGRAREEAAGSTQRRPPASAGPASLRASWCRRAPDPAPLEQRAEQHGVARRSGAAEWAGHGAQVAGHVQDPRHRLHAGQYRRPEPGACRDAAVGGRLSPQYRDRGIHGQVCGVVQGDGRLRRQGGRKGDHREPLGPRRRSHAHRRDSRSGQSPVLRSDARLLQLGVPSTCSSAA